jgi:hypothetical protein
MNQKFVIGTPEIMAHCIQYIARLEVRDEQPWEVVIRPYQRRRTDEQLRTLWKWHGEVAAALSISTGRPWTKEDVHEIVFLPKFMPCRQSELPDGTLVHKAMRTSVAPRGVISEAMDAYMAWCYEHAIEITVPEAA